MRSLFFILLLLSACSNAPPPVISPSPGPENPASPSANMPYGPVMAGTAYHGFGSKP